MSQLVACAAEPREHDVHDQDEDDLRSRGAAIVSRLRAKDPVIVHDGTAAMAYRAWSSRIWITHTFAPSASAT
jgi:hypothetical protein